MALILLILSEDLFDRINRIDRIRYLNLARLQGLVGRTKKSRRVILMTLSSSKVARRGGKTVPGVLMVLTLLILPSVGRAQSPSQSEQTGSATQSKPLTDYERAELMRLIQELQERVTQT